MSEETLGQRIQRLRLASNLTQAQLAEKAGLSLFNLQNWEQDHREPGLGAAYRLAKALEVPLEQLGACAREEDGRHKKTKPRKRRPKA